MDGYIRHFKAWSHSGVVTKTEKSSSKNGVEFIVKEDKTNYLLKKAKTLYKEKMITSFHPGRK